MFNLITFKIEVNGWKGNLEQTCTAAYPKGRNIEPMKATYREWEITGMCWHIRKVSS